MGKNRKSNGNSGSASSQDDTNPEYKDTIDTILNDQNNQLNKEELTYLLDNILSDNIEFEKVNKNGYLMFRETLNGEKGPFIAVNPDSLRDMMQEKAGFGLDDVMKYYHNIPEFKREMVSGVVLGNKKYNFKGGAYNSLTDQVSITPRVFNEPSDTHWSGIEYTFEHEFTHALDHSISTLGPASADTTRFTNILNNEKSSAYSEAYRDKNDPSTFATESLAEAFAITQMARRYGGSNAYTLDPSIPYAEHRDNPVEINYNTWKKNNPKLAEFADKLADCKNKSECYDVFIDYGW